MKRNREKENQHTMRIKIIVKNVLYRELNILELVRDIYWISILRIPFIFFFLLFHFWYALCKNSNDVWR